MPVRTRCRRCTRASPVAAPDRGGFARRIRSAASPPAVRWRHCTATGRTRRVGPVTVASTVRRHMERRARSTGTSACGCSRCIEGCCTRRHHGAAFACAGESCRACSGTSSAERAREDHASGKRTLGACVASSPGYVQCARPPVRTRGPDKNPGTEDARARQPARGRRQIMIRPCLLDAIRQLALVSAELRHESASLRDARSRLTVQSADYNAKASEHERPWCSAGPRRTSPVAATQSAAATCAAAPSLPGKRWTPVVQE
jgi:hypothetical protein